MQDNSFTIAHALFHIVLYVVLHGSRSKASVGSRRKRKEGNK